MADWSVVTKEHVEAAIQKYLVERPEHAEPKSYYLMYNGEKLPSKYIRGMAYAIATGSDTVDVSFFNGGTETVNFFAKYGYEVIQETDDKKYSVFDSIWVATAVMAYEKYFVDGSRNIAEFSFVQTSIRDRAEKINGAPVEAARTSQWVCGDHENHTYSYLRAVDVKRRLSFPEEFGDGKEQPADLDPEDIIESIAGEVTIQQLIDFVHGEYKAMESQIIKKSNIDYIGVLDYLIDNSEQPYSNPEAPGISEEEKNRLLDLKQKGQNAVNEMKKMAAAFADEYGLDKCLPMAWLDGSNTKTRKYLWAQLKYSAYADNPISVSIFVEKYGDKSTRYRVSLEIKNDGTDKKTMAKYHSFLDLPLDKAAGLQYIAGSNEWGHPDPLSDPQEVVKQKVESGAIRKVQLSKYVERTADSTNASLHEAVSEAIAAIIPYYEHVIDYKKSKRVWLVTWNPANWDWKTYGEWCAGTKEGNKYIEPWTCSSKQPAVGDDVFLMKTGDKPRGIIAHGVVAKAPYEAPHYNPEKAAEGATTGHIDVEYDRIQDYSNEPMLDQEMLKVAFPEQTWSPMGSGIEIKEKYVAALMKMWQEIDDSEGDAQVSEVNIGLNTILYGPPGTGKTYNSVIYAVAICEKKSIAEVAKEEYTEVKKRFDALMKAKRIAFTTFHQSYGYEEFIEGIKPITKDGNVTYDVIPGVFKEFCDKAGDEVVEDSPITFADDVTVWKVTIKDGSINDVKKDCFENGRVRIGWDQNPSDENGQRCLRNLSQDMQVGDIILSFKTNRSIDAIGVVNDSGYVWLEEEGDYKNSLGVDWLVTNIDEDILDINGGKTFTRTTVHKVAGIKPADIVKILKKCSNAYASVSVKKNDDNYVFVIDEINRGNISKIFGELITLIENTKRVGMDEEASAILPYSGVPFSVPANVYILGTMNTADRSIALMDTALRRRFQFIEMMPNTDVLKGIEVEGLNIAAMINVINERIKFLYDREHTIGHAFFTGLRKEPTVQKLAGIFEKSVIPLLQEYFYEDYQKIQLVLGDNGKSDAEANLKFIKDTKVVAKDIFVGSVEDVIDLPEKKYEINPAALLNIESYKKIGPGL